MAVNGNKICFIICTNDDMYLNECMMYIGRLEVPHGYEVDNIPIRDAASMAEGYNSAMALSDAKYKIYMHQDVLIINRRFIYDILDIFDSDDKVGMIGMVGNRSLANDGAPWSDGFHRRVGRIYEDCIIESGYTTLPMAQKPYEDVVVIDGLLIATQYDLPWRDDLFNGWDFYDCSQSLEYIKAGYRVVVPYIDEPWVVHDNAILNMDNYEKWRQVFEREYREIYYKWTDEYLNSREYEVTEVGIKENAFQSVGKIPLLILLHGQGDVDKRCIKSILEYCDTDRVDIAVVIKHLTDGDMEWVKSQDCLSYVYFKDNNVGYAQMVNKAVGALGIHNDFILMDSLLYTEVDFAVRLSSIMAKNGDIGTVSPLFPCDIYQELFGLCENTIFRSNIYDTSITQPYALCIRWNLWVTVGGFCDKIKGAYYAIMDFQLKALQNGYRNTVLLDTSLKSDSNIMARDNLRMADAETIRNKWGIHYLNYIPNMNIMGMVEGIKDTPIHNILEVGCAQGDNLMGLKNRYPDAALYGLELNPHAVEIAKCFSNTVCGNVETDGIPFGGVKFDVIIFGDVLEHLRNPEGTVKMCLGHLSDNGRIVCSIPNVGHISVLKGLIEGRFTYTDVGLLDKTHIHLFTNYEIWKMFDTAGYVIESMKCTVIPISAEEQEAIDKLKSVFPNVNEAEMKAFQYLVCARKK